VYVNGQYAGTTVDSQQRQILVHLPMSLEVPVRIEVFAVAVEDAYTDFSNEIGLLPNQRGRVRITLLRGQNLPIDSAAHIYFDNGTGVVAYDVPLTDVPIPIWPGWQDKAGFGISKFGIGDFGYDSAAAVGFGKGSFGKGYFGLDADAFEWVSPPLEVGAYKFGVKISDRAGNENTTETGQITVTPPAGPAEHVGVSSFDKQTKQLVLNVS
jgi:hypothetical protein